MKTTDLKMDELKRAKESIKKDAHQLIKDIFKDQDFQLNLGIEKKLDDTFVTKIDLRISEIVKKEIYKIPFLSDYAFVSEEDYSPSSFPQSRAIVLDPIDGTNELIKGVPECVVSLGILTGQEFAHSENYGLIFNPFTGFEIDSSSPWIKTHFERNLKLSGLVSKSEWRKGLYQKFQFNEISVSPRGSIAFKLGLLAAGATDFIVSFEPKKLWDIAGGTILNLSRGFSLFENGYRIKIWDKLQYLPPLCWCREEDYTKLAKELGLPELKN